MSDTYADVLIKERDAALAEVARLREALEQLCVAADEACAGWCTDAVPCRSCRAGSGCVQSHLGRARNIARAALATGV